MKKTISISFIALSIIFLFVTVVKADVSPIVVNKIRSHSVSLISEFENGGIGYCTGVVLKNTEEESVVLTAKHCVSDNQTIYVGDIKSEYYVTATIDDLALVYFGAYLNNKTPVKIAQDAKINQSVYHIGYPPSGELISNGYISSITSQNGYTDLYSIGGCSGGGIFDIEGNIVGTLWGGNKTLTVFEPLNDIKSFLNIIGINYDTKENYKESKVLLSR